MPRLGYTHLVGICVALLPLGACGHETHPPLFKRLTPGHTGVSFANTITTADSENVQTDVYVYNGAGVAIGDIDNDGLSDIFFSGTWGPCPLTLNKANIRSKALTQP